MMPDIPISSKKERERFKEVFSQIHSTIIDRLPEYVDALHDLATGVTLAEITEKGTRLYQEKPNLEALKYLMDRVMGRTVERVELGESGEFTLEEIVRSRANDKLIIDISPTNRINTVPSEAYIEEPLPNKQEARDLIMKQLT